MAKIEVREIQNSKGWDFSVNVNEENGSHTEHQVSLTKKDFDRLTGGRPVLPTELVRRSFEFLLEREPKESILPRFDLTVITRYFPEYNEEIGKRLP